MDEDFRRQMAGQKAGAAIKLTDIDGIGPATAKKIKNTRTDEGRRVEGPKQVADMSADELADKAGISRDRAAKAITGGGGNPNVSKSSSSGTTSVGNMGQPVGDFTVGIADLDKARARNDARSRSPEAVRQDERRRAPITTDLERWKNNKSGLDFPGVDTPTQEPDLLPKDLKQSQQPNTTDFEARDEREQEMREQSYPRKTESASGKENFILETGDERIPASERTGNVDPETEFSIFAQARDISLSPDEAFRGVGSGGIAEMGNNPNIPVEDRFARFDADAEQEQDELDDIAAGQSKQPQSLAADDSDGAAIAFVYRNEGQETDLSLEEFRRRTKRVGRKLGLDDAFGNAKMVADEPDINRQL